MQSEHQCEAPVERECEAPVERECEAPAELGIITSGVAYQYAKEIFPNASYLKLSMSYPLPKKLIREFVENVGEIYVIEELEPFIEEQVKAMGISVKGKDYLPICGELNPNIVRKAFLNEKPTSPPNSLSTTGLTNDFVLWESGKWKVIDKETSS